MPEAVAQPIRSNSFFSAALADVRSRDRPRDRAGARPPARRDRADRLGKHRLQGGARGAGLGDDQQIRRRLSGPALLRRLPVRRHRRKAGDRARLQAVRLPLRQRPAQFRQPGQPGRVHGADAAGRHVHGARSRRRRPSDPRFAGQHVGPLVQAGRLRRRPRDASHRHGRRRQAGARAQAEADHRRRLGLCAPLGFRALSAPSATRSGPISSSTSPISPGWWRAARIPRRSRTPMSSPPRPTRRCAARAAA